MLGGSGTKMLLAEMIDVTDKKKVIQLHMLDGAYTKKFCPLKMLDGADLEKDSLTQYVRRGWGKTALFTENARQGLYKEAPLIC